MVVVDHNMRGLMDLVDRVVVLHIGQKLAAGDPADIVGDDGSRTLPRRGGERGPMSDRCSKSKTSTCTTASHRRLTASR